MYFCTSIRVDRLLLLIKYLFYSLFKKTFFMKKLFTLFAVAALAFAAQANELTVCDNGEVGADAWNHLPVWGYWFDSEGMTQQIYPAEMLADMAGGKITALKFYTAATWGDPYTAYTIAFDGAEILLALKEVEENAYDEEEPSMIGGATVVAVTEAEYGGLYLTFELEEPFEYNGGNLLVECYWDGEGTYGQTYFRGENQENNCSYYALDYYGDWYEYASAVLSMVTFTYEGGEVPPVEPTDQTAAPSSQKENYVYEDANLKYNAYTVTLIETEPSTIYYRVGILVDGDYVYGEWMEYTGEMNFTEEGTYMIEAYAVAENKLPSEHIWDGFTVSKVVDVEELFAGKTVANVRYYNLAGQEMQQANGVTIMVTTFTDGTTSAVKVVK